MKTQHFLTFALAMMMAGCQTVPVSVDTDSDNGIDYLQYVNPIIGTNGMGHTFPGACAPFGIVQLSPDTDTVPHNIDGKYQPRVYEYCAGYQHKDSTIVGFSHTHFSGTGHSDLGDILVMPVSGEIKFNPGTQTDPDAGYRSRFSHETEKAEPGYYEVFLQDYGIKAQLTATKHAGIHRYTYPKGQDGSIILDLQHGIYNYDGKTLWANLRVENDTLLTGYRITNGWARTNYTYFAISFNQPIADYGYRELQKPKYNGMWGKFDVKHNFPEMTGRKIVAYFTFNQPETLEMKVALSATSTEGALRNLHAETDGSSFEQLLAETQAKWNKELSIIQADGTEDQKAMLYTSLYHTMINPSVYMDVDGHYRGIDHNIHRAESFTNYTVFSLWDTYRALHPLFNLLQPQRNADMVASMLKHSEQSVHGLLPVWSHNGNENWCMIGYHAVSVLADAYTKGVANQKDAMLKAMQRSSTCPYYVNLDDYQKLGYVPFDKNSGCVSVTLEYAYDDWAIYQSALKAGNQELAEQYKQRATNWRNTFDTRLGFARPKMSDGNWKEPFSLLDTEGEGFVEGNSRCEGSHQGDGRRCAVHPQLGHLIYYAPAHRVFRAHRGRDRRGLDGLLQPRQRTSAPYRLPIQLDLNALQNTILAARNHESFLQKQYRRALRQRRLRPDVGVVHLLRDGLLSCLSGQRPVCARCALSALYKSKFGQRQDPRNQGSEGER